MDGTANVARVRLSPILVRLSMRREIQAVDNWMPRIGLFAFSAILAPI